MNEFWQKIISPLTGSKRGGVEKAPSFPEENLPYPQEILSEKQARQQSADNLYAIYQTMSEGVSLHDVVYDENGTPVDYRIVDINPAYEKITHLTREQAIGALASELYKAGEPPYLKEFTDVAETGIPAFMETYFHPMKKHFAISITSPAKGKFTNVFSDITERVETEEALKKSEERFKAIFDNATDGILLVDPVSKKFVMANSAFSQALGYGLDEVPDLAVKDIHPAEDLLYVVDQFDRQAKGEFVVAGNIPVKCKDGTVFYADISASLVSWGDRDYMCGIFRDATDRKESEEKLRQAKEYAEKANQAKSEFLANVSHDVRTPMNAILGFNNLLKQTSLSQIQKKYVRIISENGKNLLALIEDVLEISKIEAREIALREITFDLYAVLDQEIEIAELGLKEKDIKMFCHLDRSVPQYVMGDPMRFKQILSNLLSNAVKYTEKGQVDIRLTLEEPMQVEGGVCVIRVSVKDTGVGIPKDKLQTVFEPFSRFNKMMGTAASKGVGLGLHIVKTFVGLMGGTIEVKSEEGQGSEFSFTAVLCASERELEGAAPELSEKEPADESVLQGARILIVEDDDASQELADLVVHAFGCQVDLASSGEEAVEQVKRSEFDLILMDLRLPGMNGYETTGVIRKDVRCQVPVLALTAHALEWVEKECLDSGMNGYMTKPFEIEELKALMITWLKGGSVQLPLDS